MTRQEANRKILELLAAEVEAYPDLRFNQILINNETIRIPDLDYYEEPMVTLKRMKEE